MSTAKSTESLRPWYRNIWILPLVALLVGLGLGAAVISGTQPEPVDPVDSTAYKDLEAELEQTQIDRANAQADYRILVGDIDDREEAIDERLAAIRRKKANLAEAQRALRQQQAEVQRREDAVQAVERKIKNNTIGGDGVYEVGTDIPPGTYKTDGRVYNCYYAVLSSPNTSDILTNNNISGPGIISVSTGNYLQLSGCKPWVLQQ